MNEKELTDVPGLKPGDKVVIKKLTYGDHTTLNGVSSNMKVNMLKAHRNHQNSGHEVSLDIGIYSLYLVVLGIKEASFLIQGTSEEGKINAVKNLPIEAGNYLMKEIQSFNNMGDTEELKKKLEQQ